LIGGAKDDLRCGMRPNIPALTSLRFFAALVVVFFHYNLARPLSPLSLGDFGYRAVTFFFVLSGFILAYAHGIPNGGLNVPLKTFIKARLVRIGPAYYLAIFMIVLLFFIAGILGRMTPTTSALVLTMLQSWISDSVTLSVISSLIIFGAAGGGGLAEKALRYGPLIVLGEASYTIYILHFPIWLWWNHYTRIVYKPDWPLAFDFGMYLAIVLVFSIAVLFWVERPARRALRD